MWGEGGVCACGGEFLILVTISFMFACKVFPCSGRAAEAEGLGEAEVAAPGPPPGPRGPPYQDEGRYHGH